MKFEKEITSERNRAFSWFFGCFSPVLMALGLLTGMPWYWCFLFAAIVLVCAATVLGERPCRIEAGVITYVDKRLRKHWVEVASAKLLLLTAYEGPLRRSGSVPYKDKDKRPRLYCALLSCERTGVAAKCRNNHHLKPYFPAKGDVLFTAMYEKRMFAELLKSFSGQVLIFRDLYRRYDEELSEAVREADFDFSRVQVI